MSRAPKACTFLISQPRLAASISQLPWCPPPPWEESPEHRAAAQGGAPAHKVSSAPCCRPHRGALRRRPALAQALYSGALPTPRPQAGALPQDPRQGGVRAQGCSSGVQRARPPSCLPPGGRSSFLLRGNALPQDPTQYLVFHEIVIFHPRQKQLFCLSNRRPYIIYTSMQLKRLDNPSNIRSLEASTNWHLAFYHHFKC
jgi:hypothetical protein